MASSSLVDVVNLAILLAWPEASNVKHRFARAIASRLLDPKQHPPPIKPKDDGVQSYGRFTEGMPTLGTFLNQTHGQLRQQAGAPKLKDFILKECVNMVIYHDLAFGKAGAVELDALAEAAGQVWPLKLGAEAEVAYAAAQVCLEKQDLVKVNASSSLNEPVLFAQLMDILRQSHAEQCSEVMPAVPSNFFRSPICSQFLQICKDASGEQALQLRLWQVFQTALAQHPQASKLVGQQHVQHPQHTQQQQPQHQQQQPQHHKHSQQQPQRQQQQQQQQQHGSGQHVPPASMSSNTNGIILLPNGQALNHSPPGRVVTASNVAPRQPQPSSEPPTKMLSLLLEQLAEQSLISGDAANSSRALLDTYEKGVPKHASAAAKAQQRLVHDLAAQLARQDETTAAVLPNRAPDEGAKQPRNRDLRISFSNQEGATCTASFAEYERPAEDAAPSDASKLIDHASDKEVLAVLECMPPHVRESLLQTLSSLPAPNKQSELVQIVADSGANMLLRFANNTQLRATVSTSMQLACSALISRLQELEVPGGKGEGSAVPGTAEELLGPANRTGIPGTLHRITSVRATAGITGKNRIIGLSYHIRRHVPGIGALLLDVLEGVAQQRGVDKAEEAALSASVLVVGPRGAGKSMLLRNMNWLLDKRFKQHVSLVDTSNDVVGEAMQPHFCLGSSRRFQVPWDGQMADVLRNVTRNHAPQVLMVDDIATHEEAAAARCAAQQGIPTIAAAKARSLLDLLQNDQLHTLLAGVGRRGIGKQPKQLARKGAPPLCTLIEVVEHGKLRVHTNLAVSIEQLLAGVSPPTQLRFFDPAGGAVARFEGGNKLPKAVKQQLAEKPAPPSDSASSPGSTPRAGVGGSTSAPQQRQTSAQPRPGPGHPYAGPRAYNPRPNGAFRPPPVQPPAPYFQSSRRPRGPFQQQQPQQLPQNPASRPAVPYPQGGRGYMQQVGRGQRPAFTPPVRPHVQPQKGLESVQPQPKVLQIPRSALQAPGGLAPTFPFQGGGPAAQTLLDVPSGGMNGTDPLAHATLMPDL